ncbi:hypothetical protein MCOR27_008636 [Pyricularia oryzae]|uniref:DUF1014-domain-containing protein n=5 Tax=Pyricularia TaxID=48558 RepID=A0ABQ8N4N7_PYRGI|nr:uncharacterized protein MGG_01484 [Pyricularia oryzae 70-15]ELQ37600.1 hypothetical protein OOU_Y34scaffold00590g115 [Pyricularia oryzae Y34]KAH8836667.1 hypothetical protein MCOR01_010338 [Pyricularia oryzae]KAI6291224.1 hypothetical protein MCOR33_010750 [Pyricularia grisea]EHA54640.1 hypothetical protein MGG_01484 [Pyricularia oryzae 70-15]KAH9438704.1 hypothetical protein MCOR02_002311 [Pyricularia oryzae]
MAGKKGGGGGENSKKAAGNARKAEAAAQKAAAEDSRREAKEAAEWDKGAKNNSKKEAEAAKKAEAARKKAEKDALLAEEEKNTPGRSNPKNAKSAVKKTSAPSRGLDLSQLDGDDSKPLSALNATGIDNALDALSLTSSSDAAKIDRHPERRFKAAYAAFEERRLKEAEADGSMSGLRLKQKQEKIRKEFEKSPENPFNQVTANYDTSKQELKEIREREKAKIEGRLTEKK